MSNIEEIKEKYSQSVMDNLDRDNFYKIMLFLQEKKCDYIIDIMDDYLDIFIFEYEEFVEKFNKLNKKYDNEFLNKASEDMNLFEEFFEI